MQAVWRITEDVQRLGKSCTPDQALLMLTVACHPSKLAVGVRISSDAPCKQGKSDICQFQTPGGSISPNKVETGARAAMFQGGEEHLQCSCVGFDSLAVHHVSYANWKTATLRTWMLGVRVPSRRP